MNDEMDEILGPDPVDVPSTLHDALRQKRASLSEREAAEFDVPGYDGLLVVKYNVTDFDVMQKILKRNRNKNDPRRIINSQMDLLINACEGFYYRRENGELKPLGHDEDPPIRFDHRLAKILDLKGDDLTARQICVGLFNNDMALISHHNDVMEWMQSNQKDADSLGEV